MIFCVNAVIAREMITSAFAYRPLYVIIHLIKGLRAVRAVVPSHAPNCF
jgi:hypothetical protein